MRSIVRPVIAVFFGLVCVTSLLAQAAQPAVAPSAPMDRMFRITGVFQPASGGPASAVESITFSIYAEEAGGTPLWQETQSVAIDSQGRYSALLGSTSDAGLPLDLFASGEPRWLGLHFQRPGEGEQARTLATSVPYALKAAKASDADTLGGRPASAYLLSPTADGEGTTGAPKSAGTSAAAPLVVNPGTTNFLAKYVNGADVGNSAVFETGGRVGINSTSPLDIVHSAFLNTTGTLTGIAVQNFGATAASYSGMLFYDQNGALGQFQGFNNSTHEYRINNIASGGTINFMVGGASKFAVANNSNIGLGTTTPQAALHIATRTNLLDDVGVTIRPATAAIKFANNPGGGGGDVAYIAQVVKSGEATTLEIGNLNDADDDITLRSSAAKVQIIGSGNPAVFPFPVTTVSAGTAGTKGQANGWQPNPGSGGTFIEGAGSPTDEGGGFFAGSNTAAIWSPGDTGALLSVYDEDVLPAGAAAFVVDGVGNIRVGSGTTGCVRDADNTIIAGVCSSDERLKKDIRPFEGDMLARALKLRAVYYHWRTELMNATYAKSGEAYGLIAQEVEKVFPEMVTVGEEGYKAVDYGKLQYVLLGALKEEHAKVEALDAKVNTLEKRLAILETETAGATGWGSALWMVFAGLGAGALAWLISLRGRRSMPLRSELPGGLPVQ